jgi:sugar phosphate permease
MFAMLSRRASFPATNARFSARWSIAFLVRAAIAISYPDRQTLPWAIKAIQTDIPFSNQIKAGLDSVFLVTYGLMYVGGGLLPDRLGTRRGFLCIMIFWSLACASHGLAGGVIAFAATLQALSGIDHRHDGIGRISAGHRHRTRTERHCRRRRAVARV